MIPRDALEAAELINRLDRLSRNMGPSEGLNPAQRDALRYLARANRFSRTPAALAEYLGSTRGTVSQTLIALEQKGHVSRTPCDTDRRSVRLSLTPTGMEVLDTDPILALAADLATAAGPDLSSLVTTLRAVLAQNIARNDRRPFGVCYSCRHFRKSTGSTDGLPHHCALLNEALSEADSRQICAEQEPACDLAA